MTVLLLHPETEVLASPARPLRPLYVPPTVDPRAPEPECECQDTERCPVHHGYDD